MLFSSLTRSAGSKKKWSLTGSTFFLFMTVLSLTISTYPIASFSQTSSVTGESSNNLSLQDKKLSRLELLKKSHQKSPENQAIAAQLATIFIQMARRETNAEYYHLANKVIEPWIKIQNLPGLKSKPITDELRLVRATLSQHIHHYKAASEDLLHIIKNQPRNAQAWLTLSTIQLVQGDYKKAQVSCSALSRVSSNWLSTLCYSQLYSLTGSAEKAYGMQQSLLTQLKGQQSELALWATGLLAETAMRLGNKQQAEKYFQDGLKIKAKDTYILRTYSDFLLEKKRAKDVIQLLQPQVKNQPDNDQLLLRLALAVKKEGDSKREQQLKKTLEIRYENALKRHGHIHGRDEALFLMEFKTDDNKSLKKALKLALVNWKYQKEPDDALILLRAATASNDRKKVQQVLTWLKRHKLEDVRLKRFQ